MVQHFSGNSIRKFWCTLFPVLYFRPCISRVWNEKSEKCAPFDHFAFFQSSPCTSYKGYIRPDRKSKNGLKMINVILPSFHTNTNEMPNHFILLFLLRKRRFIVQPSGRSRPSDGGGGGGWSNRPRDKG